MPLKDPAKRKEYHAQYMRDVWYPKNKKKHIGYVKNLKIRIQKYLQEYKRKGKCKDCGISGARHPEIFDFDHLGGKTFEIGGWAKSVLSLERVQAEMKKCELVCANCHRIRTAKRSRRQAVQ